MPANVVRSPEQEAAWERAKKRVREEYPDIDEKSDRFYALVMTIFKKMAHYEPVAKAITFEVDRTGHVLAKGMLSRLLDQRREVQHPGLRGGRYWLDAHGRVRYGTPRAVSRSHPGVGPIGHSSQQLISHTAFHGADEFLEAHKQWLPQDHADAAQTHADASLGPEMHPDRSRYHEHMAAAHRTAAQLKSPASKRRDVDQRALADHHARLHGQIHDSVERARHHLQAHAGLHRDHSIATAAASGPSIAFRPPTHSTSAAEMPRFEGGLGFLRRVA